MATEYTASQYKSDQENEKGKIVSIVWHSWHVEARAGYLYFLLVPKKIREIQGY